MNCPRCEAVLEECEPNERWLRHWLCGECCIAFRLVKGYLEPGRRRSNALEDILAAREEHEANDRRDAAEDRQAYERRAFRRRINEELQTGA